MTGGRVDYLERHAVATLVYRYREHVIDVFVRPGPGSAARSSRPPVSTVRGFNVVRVNGAGMDHANRDRGRQTGLLLPDDYGARWTQVSANRDLMHRPWYYTHVFADTGHADTVYVTNLQMWKSTDGGTSFSEVTTRHGDNHDLWIDPNDSSRMIEGNDGGANVSFNGGSWSTIYNQKTAQFYRIDVDDQYPYRVYGTQQDNTRSPCRAPRNGASSRWPTAPIPAPARAASSPSIPDDHNIVYVGAIGSSPGGAGALQRYDHRTRQIQLVNVWPEESTGICAQGPEIPLRLDLPDRVLAARRRHALCRRQLRLPHARRGHELAEDLARPQPERPLAPGPFRRRHHARKRRRRSPCDLRLRRRIAASAGRDLGLDRRRPGACHARRRQDLEERDAQGMPKLAYVGCVEISAHDADTIYVAATRYKLADYKPYLFKSTDGGRSWKSIKGDLPANEITRVVRADPVAAGLLYVGTETGIFFSLDDGAHWTRMAGGLPVVPVYDLKLKDTDLVAATHGRSFWILDDVTALRGMADSSKGGGRVTTRLFAPRTAIRTKLHWSAGANVRGGIAYGPAFGIDGSTSWSKGPTARGCASISMSARTRRTARSSTTGWPRTPRSRWCSPSAMAPAARSWPTAATTRTPRRRAGRAPSAG